MAHLHLIIGPVGAGKSTLAQQLADEQHAVWFNLDSWMAALYAEDERPVDGRIVWYLERVDRCIEQIWEMAQALIAVDTSVVLELGLVRRDRRQAFYGRIDAAAIEHTVWLVDASRDVRRKRVERRNDERGDTFSVHVPPEIFEIASDAWQPPDALEQDERVVRRVEA